jgi:hypothetical protein
MVNLQSPMTSGGLYYNQAMNRKNRQVLPACQPTTVWRTPRLLAHWHSGSTPAPQE